VRAKNWGKNFRKSSKNVFLYSHEYSDQKMGEKKRAKQFFQQHSINAGKILRKNRRKKVREMFFYIHTNIVTTKWREKNARNNFSRKTRIVRAKNFGKKSSEKNA